MREERDELNRRKFLKTGIAVAAGAAWLGTETTQAAAPKDKKIVSDKGIPMRKFGKTGHTLPVLGHGGSAMVQQFIRAYGLELTPLEERIAMVRHGYDSGIRYFDTARVYGESESIVGKALKDVRDEVYISSKCAVYTPDRVRQSVETSLTQLGTSYVDCMQIHSPSIERVGFDGGMKIHDELMKLRDEGMIRFIGVTTHIVFETVHKMISTGGFDQVLLAYGYFRRGMTTILSNRNVEWREMCLAKAHELNMGVVAMKVMGANVFSHNAKNLVPDYEAAAMEKLPSAALRWVLADPRVCVLNVGMSFASDIDKNIAALKGDLTLTNDDRRLLADFAGKVYDTDEFKKMEVS